MKIDTLIFSGGGTKCLSFYGSLKYLFEHNIINENFKNINKMICVSGGLLYILPLLLDFTIDSMIYGHMKLKYDVLLDYENISINNVLKYYGLFNNFNERMVVLLLERKGYKKDYSLKDLYQKTNIEIIAKTINLTKGKIEYISYKNYPELPIRILINMTSSIPILFKPVIYNNNYYVDGGLCGNYPGEINKSKNYLGFNTCPQSTHFKIDNFFDFNIALAGIIGRPININNKKTINIKLMTRSTNFNLSEKEKSKIIKEGYKQTKKHFKNY
jgi:NTE family protein